MENYDHEIDYILVNVENVKLDINGILSHIVNGNIKKYDIGQPHMTIINHICTKGLTMNGAFLSHTINNMISNAPVETIDGVDWYIGKWKIKCGEEMINQVCDTIFYDEFLFLTKENLIKMDSYICKTSDDISKAFDASHGTVY